MSGGPVFIGGLSFSGKTQMRLALSAHPELALTRRTALWHRYRNQYGDLAVPHNLDRCLSAMLRDPRITHLAPDRARIERELRTGPATYARLCALVHEHHAQRHGARRWGEQIGAIERYADQVFAAYPEAQMIHMIRDPRMRQAAAAADRQAPGRLGWETARWCHSADLADHNLAHHPGRYRVVRYEALRDRPEATLRAVARFLHEDYDPAMLAALAFATFDDPRHAPDASNARQATAFIEQHADVQMRALGYLPAYSADVQARSQRSLLDEMASRVGNVLWHSTRPTGPPMSRARW